MLRAWSGFAIFLALVSDARAELVALDVLKRELFADGKAFDKVGAYEQVTAVARFALDPKHTRNKIIVDLEHAPRNADGKVEFTCDVVILRPKDMSKANGAILYDVNNRGNKLALGMFNTGGDDFLLRRGYTIVWSGWSGEVLPGGGRLLLEPPIASYDGTPITGVVRFEMSSDVDAETLPLSRRENHGSHPPTREGEAKATLTYRMRETDPRVSIPREQWSLVRVPLEKVAQGVQGTMQQLRVKLKGGFRAGYIYEVVYEGKDPIVQGVGLAGVRDLVSFLKYDAGNFNPLLVEGKPGVNRAHGFGVSQSGRFLRHFLWQGFNADEKGRKVFDGLMPHVAGGGLGSFNHRFAQPTRHNGQHEEHLFPGDMFPFTYGVSDDPYSKQRDGILKRLADEDEKLLPKVMHTQSAAEYWHRSGSLVHTDPLGKTDADIPANVRIYAFGGTQHGPAGFPPGRGGSDNLLNPGDYRPLLRALLDALDAWVVRDIAPPASVFPRIDSRTLVAWNRQATGFPALPGVRYPQVIQQPAALDRGPDFLTRGIIRIDPPKLVGPYIVRVPKSDADGNDLGCLLPPEVAVPLATYTGWNLRRREVGAEAMLFSLAGSYIPFPTTAKEKKEMADPRQSIQERYGDLKEYTSRLKKTCEEMEQKRLLLAEDTARVIENAEKRWDAVMLRK